MDILYKDKNDVKISVEIVQNNGIIEFEFYSDCGKFGTDESLAGYRFNVERLLQIFAGTNVQDDEII